MIGAGTLRILELHPGTACSLKCTFCYRQGAGYGSTRPPMSPDGLVEVVQQFADMGGQELYVSGGMEPFSRPEACCAALSRGRARGLHLRVYTNGVAQALGQPRVQRIVATTANEVRFSIHAATRATYDAVHRPISGYSGWETVLGNIIALARRKNAGGGAKIGVCFLVLPENAHELVPAAGLWANIGLDFMDVRADVRGQNELASIITTRVETLRREVASGRLGGLHVSIGDRLAPERAFAEQCFAPLAKLVVDPYGWVWTCCYQSQPGCRPDWARAGDLTTQTLAEVAVQLSTRLPLRHCQACTPWEAAFNRSVCGLARNGRHALSHKPCHTS